MAKLAINGGDKIRNTLFPAYNLIDDKEIQAVTEVLKTGKLSNYLGSWHPNFYGGVQVKALEEILYQFTCHTVTAMKVDLIFTRFAPYL